MAFVRAGSFFENYLFGLQAAQGGTLPIFYAPTDRKLPMIATEDIGAEIARLLTTEWTGKRIIELASMFSADDLAAGLGQALGRDVKAQAIRARPGPARSNRWECPREAHGPLKNGRRRELRLDRPRSRGHGACRRHDERHATYSPPQPNRPNRRSSHFSRQLAPPKSRASPTTKNGCPRSLAFGDLRCSANPNPSFSTQQENGWPILGASLFLRLGWDSTNPYAPFPS